MDLRCKTRGINSLATIVNSVLPHRQLRNNGITLSHVMTRVLPNRQLRIGQEESNLPAEQAVSNQNHQV